MPSYIERLHDKIIAILNEKKEIIIIQMKFKRRSGISLERTDKNALYVRMLGDVRGRSRLEQSREKRSITISDSDYRLLEALELSEVRHRPTGRFLSLPRHRLRKQPYKFENKANCMLVDDLYIEQTKRLLCKVGQWNFSTFALHNMTSGRPVVHLCNFLFHQYGLVHRFSLDYVKMLKCFSLIEDGYHGNNPYHNAVHAADVTQAMHCYLQEAKISESTSPIEIMSALLAAVCHDLDHPGVNQAFLIATSNHLASLYKNSSVLENHHWRLAVTALHESGIFDHLDSSDRSTIEWQIKSLILATDITRQNEFLTRFKRHLDQGDLNMSDKEHRHFILQIAVKCADISNPCRSWDLSKRWSERVCEEFFQQGDLERHLSLPVTPLCDRFLTTVAKIQSGFMQFVVLPLFQEWKRFSPTSLSLHMLQNVENNRTSWEAIISTMNESQMKLQKLAPVDVPAEESSSEEEEEDEVVVVQPKKVSIIKKREDLIAALENISISLLLGRRHSIPLSIPKLESRTIIRRESFPTIGRRTFLPRTHIFHSTSADRISEKVTVRSSPIHGCTSLESITRRPKITSLTSSASASKLSSAYAAQGTAKAKFLRRASTPARFLGATEFGKHSKPTFHKSPLVSDRVQFLVAKSREPSVSSTTDSESSSSSTFPLSSSLPPRHSEFASSRLREMGFRSGHSVVSWAESSNVFNIKRRSSDSFDSRRRASDSYDTHRRGSGGVDPQEAINVLARRGSGECQRQSAGSDVLLQRRGSGPLMPIENLLNRRRSEPQEGLGILSAQDLPRRGSEPLDLFKGLIRRHSESQESLGILSDDAFRQEAGCLEAVLGGLLGAQKVSESSQESLVDLLHRRHSAPQDAAEWVASAMAASEQRYTSEGMVPPEEELEGSLEMFARGSAMRRRMQRFSSSES